MAQIELVIAGTKFDSLGISPSAASRPGNRCSPGHEHAGEGPRPQPPGPFDKPGLERLSGILCTQARYGHD